ncbi:DNA repair protein XRCC4 isoform X2 [Ascaphus truei]|uniref:DNA repair protein XRCC4 isoform X2 n=1 Tax=Ascaphus truei TaxID=8439 RepID=UPI003F5AA2A1
MERKVSKITVLSDPGTTYFLQVVWEKDLGNGFTATLCDGHAAWIGEVSEEDVSKEANDMEMERPKYVEELKKALIMTALPANKYNFDLLKDEENSECYSFTYEKKLKEVLFKLGSLRLRSLPHPAEVIKELINYCLNCATELNARNEHLQKENQRLRCDWKDMHEQLEKWVDAKEDLEQDLYTRFTCVLNEKKAKIRSLKEKLSESQQKLQQKSEDTVPVDTAPTDDIKVGVYDDTTDEEVKSQQVTTETATSSRRRSLINSPDDTPDVAPTRKRRQRMPKSSYTEVKVKNQEPEKQEKQRYNTVPSKTTGKNPSSERTSLQTSKNTPDPDDLFSDI